MHLIGMMFLMAMPFIIIIMFLTDMTNGFRVGLKEGFQLRLIACGVDEALHTEMLLYHLQTHHISRHGIAEGFSGGAVESTSQLVVKRVERRVVLVARRVMAELGLVRLDGRLERRQFRPGARLAHLATGRATQAHHQRREDTDDDDNHQQFHQREPTPRHSVSLQLFH